MKDLVEVHVSADRLTIDDIEGGGFCDISLGDHCHEYLRVQTKFLTDEFTCNIKVYEVR